VASEAEFIIVGGDAATQSAVTSAMSEDVGLAYGGACPDISAMANHLEQQSALVVFVDVDSAPDPDRLFRQLELATAQHPTTRFIVLARELSGGLVMRSMQAGARHVQAKDAIADELAGVVQRLVATATAKSSEAGFAVTVLSASGGCGATTIAVNLANELQILMSRQVLIMDLDYAYGAVGTYLDATGQFGIADVREQAEEIDAQMVRSTAVRFSEQLHVMLSPVSTGNLDPPPLTSYRLDSVLLACKQGYRATVIDAPRISMEVAATLARASVLTLVVMQPSVKDTRMAKALLHGLRQAGVPSERVQSLVNRCRSRRMVPLGDIREALGVQNVESVTNDYASVIKSINYGAPLSESAPRSTVRKELAALASQVQARLVKHNGSA